MRIDLHVHYKERSGCSQLTQEEQVRNAIELGLATMAITDHNHMIAAADMARLREQFAPFPIIQGVERNVAGEEFVVLGVEDPAISQVAPEDPEFHVFVRAHGGYLFIAHPYRYHEDIKTDLLTYPVDAVEGFSSNLDPRKWPLAAELARSLGVPLLANSDSHRPGVMGRYYNELTTPVDVTNLPALFATLRAGAFQPVFIPESPAP